MIASQILSLLIAPSRSMKFSPPQCVSSIHSIRYKKLAFQWSIQVKSHFWLQKGKTFHALPHSWSQQQKPHKQCLAMSPNGYYVYKSQHFYSLGFLYQLSHMWYMNPGIISENKISLSRKIIACWTKDDPRENMRGFLSHLLLAKCF